MVNAIVESDRDLQFDGDVPGEKLPGATGIIASERISGSLISSIRGRCPGSEPRLVVCRPPCRAVLGVSLAWAAATAVSSDPASSLPPLVKRVNGATIEKTLALKQSLRGSSGLTGRRWGQFTLLARALSVDVGPDLGPPG